MFAFDYTTIIISVVLLLIALLTSLINPFFRKVRIAEYGVPTSATESEETIDEEEPAEEADVAIAESIVSDEQQPNLPPITIILTPHDNAQELAKNLPLYLNQDYPTDFQVIVVAPQNDHETGDVLKRFAANPHLYSTFIPESSRYMSKKKLAITLGVKAAKYDWVIMADINCYPTNDNWLQAIARNCKENKELVVGYTHYEEETPAYRQFERHYIARYIMREYQRNKAYACPFNALAFRKATFLREEGFRGNLKYIRGEYDFMVNKYAKGSNLAFENSPEGTLIEETPTEKVWLSTHLFYMENRQHLQRTPQHRLLPYIDQTALHGNYLLQCVALAGSLLLGMWTIAVAAGLSLILTIILRLVMAKKALRRFDIDIPAWKIIPYELAIAWKHLGYKLKYHRADKYDFISHKL